MALPALYVEPPRRGGSARRAWARHLLRNHPKLGAEATRAQVSMLQIGSIRSAFPQHARRHTLHLQPSTPSRLAIDAPDLSSRCGEPMVECGRASVMAH